jgi:hypothetical protein
LLDLIASSLPNQIFSHVNSIPSVLSRLSQKTQNPQSLLSISRKINYLPFELTTRLGPPETREAERGKKVSSEHLHQLMEDDEAQKKEQSNLAEFNFSKRVLCVNGRGGETPKNAGLMESGTNQSAPRHSSELDSFFCAWWCLARDYLNG